MLSTARPLAAANSGNMTRLPDEAHKLFAVTTAPEAIGFLTSEASS